MRKPITDLLSAWEGAGRIAAHFGVSCPNVNTRASGTGGHYKWTKQEIYIGQRTVWPMEATLVHEMAHHISYTKYHAKGHGETFQRVLLEVIRAWYKDDNLYPWNLEYPAIRAARNNKRAVADMLKELE